MFQGLDLSEGSDFEQKIALTISSKINGGNKLVLNLSELEKLFDTDEFVPNNNKKSLLFVWNAQCWSSMREWERVLRLKNEYENAFNIVSLNMDKDPRDWVTFSKNNFDETITNYRFKDGWTREFNDYVPFKFLPALFFVDGEGKVFCQNPRGDEIESCISLNLN